MAGGDVGVPRGLAAAAPAPAPLPPEMGLGEPLTEDADEAAVPAAAAVAGDVAAAVPAAVGVLAFPAPNGLPGWGTLTAMGLVGAPPPPTATGDLAAAGLPASSMADEPGGEATAAATGEAAVAAPGAGVCSTTTLAAVRGFFLELELMPKKTRPAFCFFFGAPFFGVV